MTYNVFGGTLNQPYSTLTSMLRACLIKSVSSETIGCCEVSSHIQLQFCFGHTVTVMFIWLWYCCCRKTASGIYRTY